MSDDVTTGQSGQSGQSDLGRSDLDQPGLGRSDLDLPDPQLSTVSWGREGYVATEVDAFVARLRQALGEDRPALAPYQVLEQRFTVRRRGRRYALREVDEYLDAGQDRLSRSHGYEPVTTRRRSGAQHHFPVLWIYLVAFVLIVMMLLFLLTEL